MILPLQIVSCKYLQICFYLIFKSFDSQHYSPNTGISPQSFWLVCDGFNCFFHITELWHPHYIFSFLPVSDQLINWVSQWWSLSKTSQKLTAYVDNKIFWEFMSCHCCDIKETFSDDPVGKDGFCCHWLLWNPKSTTWTNLNEVSHSSELVFLENRHSNTHHLASVKTSVKYLKIVAQNFLLFVKVKCMCLFICLTKFWIKW